jgi:hypothetical protein
MCNYCFSPWCGYEQIFWRKFDQFCCGREVKRNKIKKILDNIDYYTGCIELVFVQTPKAMRTIGDN